MSEQESAVVGEAEPLWQDAGHVLTETELKVAGRSEEGPQNIYSVLNIRDIAVKRPHLGRTTLVVWVADAEGRLETVKLKGVKDPSKARRRILEQARKKRASDRKLGIGEVEIDRVAHSLAAHQAQVLDEPERERVRAQRGSAIATAAATALASAGALSNLDERSLFVLALGLAALAAWLLAAALFIGATMGSSSRGPAEGFASAPTAFVALLDGASVELIQVRRRAHAAFAVAVVAALLTIAAIVVTAADQPSGQSMEARVSEAVEEVRVDEAAEAATVKEAILVLTSSGTTLLQRECPNLLIPVRGQIDPDSLGSNFVEVTFRAGQCRETQQTLLIPAAFLGGSRTSAVSP